MNEYLAHLFWLFGELDKPELVSITQEAWLDVLDLEITRTGLLFLEDHNESPTQSDKTRP